MNQRDKLLLFATLYGIAVTELACWVDPILGPVKIISCGIAMLVWFKWRQL